MSSHLPLSADIGFSGGLALDSVEASKAASTSSASTGLATVSLYLFEGIIGLPVFSGTPEKGVGLIYFTGPTMGYLFGFMVAVYISGKFVYDSNLIKNFFKLLLATSFIYILGMAWLGNLIGWDKPIFQLGAQPFLLAELFKILIATFAINQVKKIKNLI